MMMSFCLTALCLASTIAVAQKNPPSTQGAIVKSKSNITNNRVGHPTTYSPTGEVEGLIALISRKDGSIVATQVTDKDGNVDFALLPEGEYVLTLIAVSSNASERTTNHHDIAMNSIRNIKARVAMKPDSNLEKDGIFADSGQVTLRSDGKTPTRLSLRFQQPEMHGLGSGAQPS